MSVKPILFNGEVVWAILDDRKTVTRRVIKGRVSLNNWMFYKMHDNKDGALTCGKDKLCAGFYHDGHIFYVDGEKHIDAHYYCAPYRPGDILYVWETYCWCPCWDCGMDTEEGCCDKTAHKFYNKDRKEYGCYGYKASFDDSEQPFERWHPSIHMPKEAARIWLRVTDVRVERLQDMTVEDCKKEGAETDKYLEMQEEASICGIQCETLKDYFAHSIWDSTIKKKDLLLYGWGANPWVWVIEFERCEKPKEV